MWKENNLYIILLVCGFIWTVESTSCKDDKDVVHTDGSTWKKGPCVECTCNNGQEMCVSQACEQPKCDKPVHVDGKCCPICNTTVDCSQISCGIPVCANNQVPITLPGDCCPSCPQDCRVVRCALPTCLPGLIPVVPPGKCCPECTDCKTVTCKKPDCSDPITPSNKCCSECPDCSLVKCAKPDCDNPVLLAPRDCCKVCPEDCSIVRCALPVCLPGLTPVVPPGKCCPKCTDCKTVTCKKPDCSDPIIPSDKCCPECQDCSLVKCAKPDCDNPVLLAPGDCCKVCPDCSTVSCLKPDCSNPVTPPGKCCPVCTACKDNKGIIHDHGTSWNVNDCEGCRCENGRAMCYTPSCAQPPCENPIRVKGQCCPTCINAQCKDKTGVHPHGSEWKEDPCSTCTCENGRPLCYTLDCARPKCRHPIKRKDQCCPTCEKAPCADRLDRNKRHQHGEKWKETKCRSCKCENGFTRCKTMKCRQHCPGVFFPSNQCCPICLGGWSGGKTRRQRKSFPFLSRFFGF